MALGTTDFWNTSPSEFFVRWRGWLKTQGVTGSGEAGPSEADKAELRDFMMNYEG